MSALPSREATLTRKPWAGGVRARGIGAKIYADLRAELVSLKRLPGEPISEAELAKSYGFSRTPAREAVRKLADEGLVEIFPQSGTFVSRIPLAALPEAIVIRKALEETSARLAAERARRSQIIALLARLERQREASRACDRDAFHQTDEAFHRAIAEAAGYRGIWTWSNKSKCTSIATGGSRCLKRAAWRAQSASTPQSPRRSRPATACARLGRWAFIWMAF